MEEVNISNSDQWFGGNATSPKKGAVGRGWTVGLSGLRVGLLLGDEEMSIVAMVLGREPEVAAPVVISEVTAVRLPSRGPPVPPA